MKRSIIIIIAFLFLTLAGWGKEKKQLEALPQGSWQEINLSGGLSGNGYGEVEPSYTYMLNRKFGLTAGANFILGVTDEDYYNSITGEFEKRFFDLQTLLLRPAVRFRIPIAYQNKAELFALNIEPGIYIPIGKNEYKPNSIADQLGNKNLDWLYLNLKTAITLDLCPLFLSVGYTVSDFSHQADKFRLTHTGFIQIGFAF